MEYLVPLLQMWREPKTESVSLVCARKSFRKEVPKWSPRGFLMVGVNLSSRVFMEHIFSFPYGVYDKMLTMFSADLFKWVF